MIHPPVVVVDAWRSSPWDWANPTRWECLRCGFWFLTREPQPRCPVCGFVET
jgi:rubrerythrin